MAEMVMAIKHIGTAKSTRTLGINPNAPKTITLAETTATTTAICVGRDKNVPS
jgi:hypothetical protein